MPRPILKLGRYKGPVIVLVLSASLIAALAIPKVNTFIPAKQKPAFVMNSLANGTIKRSEATVGQFVKVGDPLLVITDPALEAEILRLENELKLAMLGTKEVVVETGMLGMIGSLPRVVYETEEPRDLPKQEISTPPTSAPIRPKTASEIAAGEKLVDDAISKVFNVEVAFAAKEVEQQEANVKVSLAETDLMNAERGNGTATKEKERLQKLYDMGAIAKNKLDSGLATSEQTAKEVEEAKAKLAQARETQSSLEKQVAQLKTDLASLRSQLESLRAKLKGVQAKVEPAKQALTPGTTITAPRRVKRIVYGTSPEASNAPVEVNLVDSKDPTQDKRVEEIRAKLLALKKKRDALRVTADVAGVITFLVTPNTDIRSGDHLVTIQP